MDTADRLAVTALGGCVALGLYFAWQWPVEAHEWFPPSCCSGFDCRVIDSLSVKTTPQGFALPGNLEIVPYASPKIRRTPPEGEGNFALCTQGGKPDTAVICLYIPDWGT